MKAVCLCKVLPDCLLNFLDFYCSAGLIQEEEEEEEEEETVW